MYMRIVNRYITLFLLSIVSILAHGSDTNVVGRVRISGSSSVASGYVLTLFNPYFGVDNTLHTLVVPNKLRILLDSTGNIPSGYRVPDIATMSPGNTYYIASLIDPYGRETRIGYFRITGSTFDIGSSPPSTISFPNYWSPTSATQIQNFPVDVPVRLYTIPVFQGAKIIWPMRHNFDTNNVIRTTTGTLNSVTLYAPALQVGSTIDVITTANFTVGGWTGNITLNSTAGNLSTVTHLANATVATWRFHGLVTTSTNIRWFWTLINDGSGISTGVFNSSDDITHDIVFTTNALVSTGVPTLTGKGMTVEVVY